MNITLTASALPVLIDTWWNVNSHTEPLLPVSRTVLIDTWWNVNFESVITFPSESVF